MFCTRMHIQTKMKGRESQELVSNLNTPQACDTERNMADSLNLMYWEKKKKRVNQIMDAFINAMKNLKPENLRGSHMKSEKKKEVSENAMRIED